MTPISTGTHGQPQAKKKTKPKPKPRALNHGRPNVAQRAASNPSSKTTRTIIRNHHRLSKSHAQALAAGDAQLAASIATQIAENGGLERYQAASIVGQSAARGGDTSRKLVTFLTPFKAQLRQQLDVRGEGQSYCALDVGALSTRTALSSWSDLFDVTRIDLHSQSPGILQQDFMQRPLPNTEGEKFDLVCLSLVLNYVPDAKGRGEMLKRVTKFLRASKQDADTPLPGLFLVLPAPCVTNSRYLTLFLLTEVLEALGFKLVESTLSAKLAYSLWRWQQIALPEEKKRKRFAKVEVNPGGGRNNFAIVLD